MEKGFVFSLIFAAIVAVFALKNGDKVLIDFIFTKVEVSQAIVIFASAILGAVTVSILGTMKNIKFKKEIKELNKKLNLMVVEKDELNILLEEKENEIQSLKEEPAANNTYLEQDEKNMEIDNSAKD
ncbi:LapA family protein [Schnuerera sp.]|uniref:LapA family protein n=1 Tax=Schnuerera sp. TaxID=2794844 RepID=UPI002B909001|nr:lipopolysaccharide assembly protein LapA domain-containing protein [Schnuerera sp.]HSH36635.1 lipopolysaccharide assembly protein LapA domain-containing protein [Schnuerera sp.]